MPKGLQELQEEKKKTQPNNPENQIYRQPPASFNNPKQPWSTSKEPTAKIRTQEKKKKKFLTQ